MLRFLLFINLIYNLSASHILPNGGKIWAFLAATSDNYMNYRHQADICHAYQVLHENGIDDENIIVMMKDDIAHNSDNPTPGIIINEPGGRNVYEGVLKDYTGNDVTPENFMHILTGNKSAMQGIGSGRVIESGPNDHVFVNIVDHGSNGIILFPKSVLKADDLTKNLMEMSYKSKFRKLIMYVEACHAGSMFDDLLPSDMNIIAVTASDPHESSYACYFDDERQTYLGDLYSITWLNLTEHEYLPITSIHNQFEKVRTLTNRSHVEEYGDLDIGVTKLADIIGFRTKHLMNNNGEEINPVIENFAEIAFEDSVSSIDVPLNILKRKLELNKEPRERRRIKHEIQQLLKKRSLMDTTLEKVIREYTDADTKKFFQIMNNKNRLGKINFPCYNQILDVFNQFCFDISQNPYVQVHLQKLVNICSTPELQLDNALNAVKKICDTNSRYLNIY